MSAREELLKENEARIKEKEEHISSLFASLGRSAGKDAVAGSDKLESACSRASTEREAAEERLASLKKAFDEHEDRLALLAERKKDRSRLLSELDDALSALGAAVYEKCSFSLLDKDAFASVYKDIGDGKGGVRSFFSEITKKRRFLRYGRFVVKNNLDSMLDGNALRNAEEIRTIHKEIEGIDNERKTLQEQINARKRSYSALSKDGLERAEKNAQSAREKEDEAYRCYGAFLFERKLALAAPGEESLDSDTAIIAREKRELDFLIAERKRLKREAKADDLMALLENEEKKLSILGKEKERIDQEIRDVEQEISKLKAKLADIKREGES